MKEFEEWMEGIIHAAVRFDGFMGVNVIRPGPGGADLQYVIIFRFDSRENLDRWECSQERKKWLEKSGPVVEGDARVEVRTGIEFWFTPSAGNNNDSDGAACKSRQEEEEGEEKKALRYKMALVIIPVITALLATLAPLVRQATEGLPEALRMLMGVAITVLLMTYVIMPALVRALSPWLYKKSFL